MHRKWKLFYNNNFLCFFLFSANFNFNIHASLHTPDSQDGNKKKRPQKLFFLTDNLVFIFLVTHTQFLWEKYSWVVEYKKK